jgi:hypothetical protein
MCIITYRCILWLGLGSGTLGSFIHVAIVFTCTLKGACGIRKLWSRNYIIIAPNPFRWACCKIVDSLCIMHLHRDSEDEVYCGFAPRW